LRPADLLGDCDAEREDAVALRARVQQLEDQVAFLQRMSMLGTLAAMVAHEFNNLMTPVLARAQIALTTGDAVASRKALDCAFANAQKAIGITAHLLNMPRRDQEDAATCAVAAAVQHALEVSPRPLEREGVTVTVDVPADLTVAARPLLFEQVLLNLVLNARAALRGRAGALSIVAHRDGEVVVLQIRDSGAGMPAEHIDRVLNPFLAADPERDTQDWRSVGLGLNVCRTIARQHAASLRARLNDGPGVTFELRWPAA
jgi:signal transduction histidine kinase